MRRWKATAAVAALGLCVAGVVRAEQDSRDGVLEGRIVDSTGRPLAGLVVAIGPGGPFATGVPAEDAPTAVTDVDGRYRLEGVRPGEAGLHANPASVTSAARVRFRFPDVSRLDLVLPSPARARVRLVQEDGTPVAGARVRARWDDLHGRGHVLATASRDDGAFDVPTLGGLFGGVFQVDAVGFVQPSRFRLDDFAVDVPGTATWTLTRGADLEGVVTGPDGPVRAATVCLALPQVVDPVLRTTVTDAAGRYRFIGVPEGSAAVRVVAEGLAHDVDPSGWTLPVQASSLAGGVAIPASGTVRHDVLLGTGARVTGRVRGPDGAPFGGARVLVPGNGGPPPVAVVSGADGRFVLEHLPRVSPLQVLVIPPRGLPAVARVRLDAELRSATCDVQLTRIAGHGDGPRVRVRTRAGEVPEGLRVDLERLVARSPGRSSWRLVGTAQVDAAGAVLLADFDGAPGDEPMRLRFEATGFAPAYSDDFRQGATEDLADVVLVPAPAVTGRAVDARTGAPVAGAWIVADGTAGHPGLPGPWLGREVRAVSGPDGRFELPAASRDAFVTYVAYAAGYVSVGVERRIGTENARCRLEPCHALRGQVVDQDGRPVAGALLTPGSSDIGRRTTTDADGTFALATLPGEDVELRLRAPPRRDAEFGIGDIGPFDSDQTNVRIRLPPRFDVVGRVLDTSGRPLAGASILLLDVESGAAERRGVQRSGADGGFAFERVDRGVYELAVWSETHVPRLVGRVVPGIFRDVVLEDGATTTGRIVAPPDVRVTNLEIEVVPLSPGGVVRGRGGAEVWPPARRMEVAKDGTFRVRGLGPGEFTLRIAELDEAPWSRGLRADRPFAGGQTDVELHLRRVVEALFILSSHDQTPVEATIVVAPEGEPTSASVEVAVRSVHRVELDGTRRYHLRLKDTRHLRLENGDLVIEPQGGRHIVRWEVRSLATLWGRLVDSDGRSVGGRAIRLAGPLPEDDVTVFANAATGRFVARRRPLGSTTAWLLPRAESDGAAVRIGTFEFSGEDVELVLPEK